MKQITIAIHDNSKKNYSCELIKFVKDNLISYPKLTEEIEIVYFDELVKFKQDELPNAIKYFSKYEEYNQALLNDNSRYIVYVDAIDLLLNPLEQLVKMVKKQNADVIVTPLMCREYDGKTNLIETEAQIRLFEKEKFTNLYHDVCMHQVKGTIFKQEFLKEHQLIYDNQTTFAFFAKVMLNVPVIDVNVVPFYAVRNLYPKNETVNKELEKLIADYHDVLDYQKIDLNHPYNKFIYESFHFQINQLLSMTIKVKNFDYQKINNEINNLKKMHLNEIKMYGTKLVKTNDFKLIIQLVKLKVNEKYNLKHVKNNLIDILYGLINLLPVKREKVLIINDDNNYQGEMKYLVNKLINDGEEKIYCTSMIKVKGIKSFNQANKIRGLYYKLTAQKIIYLDMQTKILKTFKNQEVIQLFTDFNHQKILFDQNNYADYFSTEMQKQIKLAFKDNVIFWTESKENKRYLYQSVGSKRVKVKEFASSTWINKYSENNKMITLLRKKYNFEMLNEYVLYIADKVPYHQFIDVKQLNNQLSKNQILVIIPPKNNYDIVNISKQGYMLLDDKVNVVELCLAADAIFANNHCYVEKFKKLNKKIISINYQDEIRNKIVGEF